MHVCCALFSFYTYFVSIPLAYFICKMRCFLYYLTYIYHSPSLKAHLFILYIMLNYVAHNLCVFFLYLIYFMYILFDIANVSCSLFGSYGGSEKSRLVSKERLLSYFDVVYLVTALVPSLTACLANSPGKRRRTAVCTSLLLMVDLLL